MTGIVLDTDVASRIIRHRLTGPLVRRLPGMTPYVTFVTAGELWKWAALRDLGAVTRFRLIHFLQNDVGVLPYGEGVAKLWGDVTAAAMRRGRTPPVNDSWIAACCLARGLPLATLNGKDFADLAEHEGLELVGV